MNILLYYVQYVILNINIFNHIIVAVATCEKTLPLTGIEPRFPACKSGMLPLHYRGIRPTSGRTSSQADKIGAVYARYSSESLHYIIQYIVCYIFYFEIAL